VNVRVLADPAGRLVWVSPALPGARHDMGAALEHGLIDGVATAGVQTLVGTACHGGGPAIRVPQPRRRLDSDTGRYRPLSRHPADDRPDHATGVRCHLGPL
jgi:hypothetical protein